MNSLVQLFSLDGWKKMTFGVMVMLMGYHLTYTRHMSGEAFAGMASAVMLFIAGALVADNVVNKREARLTGVTPDGLDTKATTGDQNSNNPGSCAACGRPLPVLDTATGPG
jgi:hypothetical protein